MVSLNQATLSLRLGFFFIFWCAHTYRLMRFCECTCFHVHHDVHTHACYSCIVPMGLLPWEIQVAFPGESQLPQSRTTQPTVHTGCLSVSIIHQTLTWTAGSLTCTRMFMHAIAHGDVRIHVRESALKVDSGRKIPFHTWESNLCQRRGGTVL